MYATLNFQRGPLFALLGVLLLALMAALAPGPSEVELSSIADRGSSGPKADVTAFSGTDRPATWVNDPLEPPLEGMARTLTGR
jgi:hypothetical protein